jgi:hypothetical protein
MRPPRQPLRRILEALPPPQGWVEGLREPLEEALGDWRTAARRGEGQDDDGSPHGMAILTPPCERLGDLLDRLAGAVDPESSLVRLGSGAAGGRPPESARLGEPLRTLLQGLRSRRAAGSGRLLVLVPHLETSLLRRIGGWQAIEELCALMDQARDAFFLIGCNIWAWQFLDHALGLRALVPRALPLPELEAADLRDWLQPALRRGLPGGDDADEPPDWEGEAFWSDLAERSRGRPAIAADLCLHALPDDEPALPSLPSLDNEDRYLLHALLLHGALPPGDLAEVLADPLPQLRARLETLRRKGLLRDAGGTVAVRAAHTLKLADDLGSNNISVPRP